MIIDCHAHLYYDEILKDIDNVLERAVNAGIEKIIVPSVDLKTAEQILFLADKYSMIYAAVGFHPCDIAGFNPEDVRLLENFIKHPKVLAIGEIGLDYFWDTSYIDKQKAFFKEQIDFAKSINLPVIIHTRNSVKDAIEIIKGNIKNLSGQFHCFSGDENDLKNILAFENFYISFCGNITFKKFSENKIIELTPVEKLLSETDSPFLSPEPFRGKTNEPSRVIYTLNKIAEIKKCNYEEMIKIIYENNTKLFF
jgi:TatD DNase family protein